MTTTTIGKIKSPSDQDASTKTTTMITGIRSLSDRVVNANTKMTITGIRSPSDQVASANRTTTITGEIRSPIEIPETTTHRDPNVGTTLKKTKGMTIITNEGRKG